MSKYVAFSDTFNGPVKLIGEDLQVGRYFIIQENRRAQFERGRLYYDGDKRYVPMHKVWFGSWPEGEHRLEQVVEYIERQRARHNNGLQKRKRR